MNKTVTFIFLILLNLHTLHAQTNDTTEAIPDTPPVIEEYDDDVEVYYEPLEATVDDYVAGPADYEIRSAKPFNSFGYNDKIRVELSPDRIASYLPGTSSLFSELFEKLDVPYMGNEKERYVVIRVTVGADSLLYNPVAMHTSGVQFTNHAQLAIQNLGSRFIPAMKNGKPVASYLYIPVRFDYILQSGRYRY